MKNFFYLILIFLFSINIFSQEKSSDEEINLPNISTTVEKNVAENKQVFNKEDIEKNHNENLSSFLESAGIQILSYGPYGLESKPSIRGFTDETVRVVIDGVCVNNPQFGTFDFSTINLNDIERIEILRGGFSENVNDEGSVAGVIYITTKKQNLGHNISTDTNTKTFFNFNNFLDSFSQSINYSGQISDNNFLNLSGKINFFDNKFLFYDYKNSLIEREDSEVFDLNSQIAFSRYFSDGNLFYITEAFYWGDKNIPGPEYSSLKGIQKDLNNRLQCSLDFPNIKNIFSWKNNFSWIYNSRNYKTNLNESDHKLNTFNISSMIDFFPKGKFHEKIGLSFDCIDLKSTEDGNHFLVNGNLKSTTKYILCEEIMLTLPLSIKFSGKNFAFTPKFGMCFIIPYLDIKINAYKMVQFPNLDDLYWEGDGYKGNKDLKPEDGYGVELIFNLKDIYIPFSFSVFTNYYKNKIQWSDNTAKNIASAFYLGLNLNLQKSFFKDLIYFRLEGEYLYTSLLDETNHSTYKKKIMWTPDFVFSAYLSFDFKICNFVIESSYVGKRYTSNNNSFYLEPYFLLDSSLDFKILKNYILYIRCDNILNIDYESVENYPMPLFSMSMGFKTKWNF